MDKILDDLEALGIQLERLTSTLCLLHNELDRQLSSCEPKTAAEKRRRIILDSVYGLCVELSEKAEEQTDSLIDEVCATRKENAA